MMGRGLNGERLSSIPARHVGLKSKDEELSFPFGLMKELGLIELDDRITDVLKKRASVGALSRYPVYTTGR